MFLRCESDFSVRQCLSIFYFWFWTLSLPDSLDHFLAQFPPAVVRLGENEGKLDWRQVHGVLPGDVKAGVGTAIVTTETEVRTVHVRLALAPAGGGLVDTHLAGLGLHLRTLGEAEAH